MSKKTLEPLGVFVDLSRQLMKVEHLLRKQCNKENTIVVEPGTDSLIHEFCVFCTLAANTILKCNGQIY